MLSIRHLSYSRVLLLQSRTACELVMVAVKYDDLSLAFDFVNSAPPGSNGAYLSLDTGQIFWISEMNPMEEELPDDLETSGRYVALPHKNDLDLGKDLALRFVEQELPDCYVRAEGFFRHKGAYGRLKQMLESEGILEKWFKFEEESLDKALREWCADNDIELVS